MVPPRSEWSLLAPPAQSVEGSGCSGALSRRGARSRLPHSPRTLPRFTVHLIRLLSPCGRQRSLRQMEDELRPEAPAI